jgi:hypothetical protein
MNTPTPESQTPLVPLPAQASDEIPDEPFEIVFAEEPPPRTPKPKAVKPRRPSATRAKRTAKQSRK